MYTKYYRLKESPFSIAPNPRFLFMSGRHQEAFAHLLYGINEGGGFVALTGEVGTGKTTLSRCLLDQLPKEVNVALVLNPKLDSVELLATICDELSIPYSAHMSSLKSFTDLLNEYLLSAHSRGKRTVLMIDEAQNLSFEVLEQIRLLTNLETSDTKLLQIILIGQPELTELLEQPELRQINQRITARYHLEPLSLAETRGYIMHRLEVSGGDPTLFNENAIRKVFYLTGGIPRLINVVCDRSMLGAYAAGRGIIGTNVVKTAAREVLSPLKSTRFELSPKFLTPVIVVGICAGVFYFFEVPPFQGIGQTITAAKPDIKPEFQKRTTLLVDKPFEAPLAQETHNHVPGATQPTTPVFADLIQDPAHTLDAALLQLFRMWNKDKDTHPDKRADCRFIENNGLHCLANRGNWNQLISFNRPSVLEFTIGENEKRYAVLAGLDDDQPVILINTKRYRFHLEKILPFWRGYFLLLWKPPNPGELYIRPGHSSTAVGWLRRTLNVSDNSTESASDPNFFGNPLKARVIEFQQKHSLVEDGVVGPRTIIHLQNTLKVSEFPNLYAQD